MDKESIVKRYECAKKRYQDIDVDVDVALERLQKTKVSMQCWQGDDVHGFLNSGDLSGGILSTGNYPGAARTPEELRCDAEKAFSLIPGKHKFSLHAIYVDTNEKVDANKIEPKHFEKWVRWAKEIGIGLDFNSTLFSHPMFKDGYTLAHPDKNVRSFWIEHCKRCRKIAQYFGKELGQVAMDNLWAPDGSKEYPIDSLGPRKRLTESLDDIFSEQIDEKYTIDTIESKLFGIGAESYTVGSHEFYMGYGISRKKVICLDSGHFHPTEVISNKISALSLFSKGIMLHVSRPVRWDSDHVVIMDDELQEITRQVVRNNLFDKVYFGLDYFDGSINRIVAWVIGMRNFQKALLKALLEPVEELKKIELDLDYSRRLAYLEELKDFPFADVWNYFCLQNNVPVGLEWINVVKDYEEKVQSKR